MTELNKVKSISIEGRTANQLLFILSDVMETLYMVSESEAEKKGLKFDAATKSAMIRLKYSIIDLRKRTVEMGLDSQQTFGDDADKLLELIMLAVDRTGENYTVMDLIINYAKAFKSHWNLKLKKFGISN